MCHIHEYPHSRQGHAPCLTTRSTFNARTVMHRIDCQFNLVVTDNRAVNVESRCDCPPLWHPRHLHLLALPLTKLMQARSWSSVRYAITRFMQVEIRQAKRSFAKPASNQWLFPLLQTHHLNPPKLRPRLRPRLRPSVARSLIVRASRRRPARNSNFQTRR